MNFVFSSNDYKLVKDSHLFFRRVNFHPIQPNIDSDNFTKKKNETSPTTRGP